MSIICYRPTPLERAHATHLLITYFNTPVNLYNDDGEMRVSGRDAVPFLTSSGVDRSLLRLIWSVADPEGVGTLTVRSQFHTILRLIAMAQAHFLPPLPTAPGMENQDVVVLKEILTRNSHLAMALPTFSRDTNPPTVAHLLAKYPSPASQQQAMGDSVVPSAERSNVNVPNILVNHDLQYQMWQKQQQQLASGSQPCGISNGDKTAAQLNMSVDDAFGDMLEVEDRPLPSLEYLVSAKEPDNDVIDEINEDDFGDFNAAHNEDVPDNHMTGATIEETYEVPCCEETAEATNNGLACIEIGPVVTEDEFIKFNTASETKNTSTAMHVENDENQFRDVNCTDIPSAEVISLDDHTELPRIERNNHATDTLTTNKLSDIFNQRSLHEAEIIVGNSDSLQQSHNASNLSIPDAAAQFTRMVENEIEDNEFSDFKTTHIESEFGILTIPASDESNINDSSTLSYSQTAAVDATRLAESSNHIPKLSISDAFESLVIDQHMSQVPYSNQNIDVAFFTETSDGANPSTNEDDASDDFKVNIIATTSEEQITQAPTSSIFGAFDTLISPHDSEATMQLTEGTDSTIEETQLNEDQHIESYKSITDSLPYETKASQAVNLSPNQNQAANAAFQNVTFKNNSNKVDAYSGGLAAFDDVFGGIEDAPLPPLEAFSPSIEPGVKRQVHDEQESDESFGDFEGDAPMGEHIQDDYVNTSSSHTEDHRFDSFQQTESPNTNGISDAHDTNLEESKNMQEIPEGLFQSSASNEFDDSFGDFEDSSKMAMRQQNIDIPSENRKIGIGDVNNHSRHACESDLSNPVANGELTSFDQTQTLSLAQPDDTEHEQSTIRFGSSLEKKSDNMDSSSRDRECKTFDESKDTVPRDESIVEESTASNLIISESPHDSNVHIQNDIGDFDTFGSVSQQNLVAKSNDDSEAITKIETSEQDFGDFAAFDLTTEEDTATNSKSNGTFSKDNFKSNGTLDNLLQNNEFGGFAVLGPTDATAETIHSCVADSKLENDDFGDFAAFESPDETLSSSERKKIEENDFGGFVDCESINYNNETPYTQEDDSVKLSPTNGQEINGNAVDVKDFESFSAFGSADAEITEPDSSSKHDDGFGDFSASDTILNTKAKEHGDVPAEEFSDFAEFHLAQSTEPASPYNDLREKICAIEQFLTPLPSKNTIIECFDDCCNTIESPKAHLSRCVILCEILTHEGSDLSRQWENAVTSIIIDLERGNEILDVFASKLSSDDRSIILKSDKLSNYILGLNEFVRVARYMMASMKDILCLAFNNRPSGAVSEYNKGKFMTNFTSIDNVWHDLSSKALDLGILSDLPSLPSVDEIRTRYLNADLGGKEQLCQWTLQPLNECDKGTSSVVTMGGKQYMTCAANLLTNRLA